MNIIVNGEHASADWLLIKLRALSGAVELVVQDDGQLNVRAYRPTNKPVRFGRSGGIYRRGIGYNDLVSDLAELRVAIERARRAARYGLPA